jgi:outer membrane protein assembly factor BamB
LNGLDADGLVNTATWNLLFSGDAVPLSHGTQLVVSTVGEVSMGGRLGFDGEYLWLAGSESLLQIDPNTGALIKSIPIPDLGEVTDAFGITYPKTFSTDEALIYNDHLWISGEVISYPNLSASAVLVFNLSGELVGGPIYLSPNQDALSWVPALFSRGGKVWAVLDAQPDPTSFELNGINFRVGRSLSLRSVEAVYDAESDDETTWISLVIDGDRSIRTLNLNTGKTGPPLDVCGYELAFDGKWLWVERSASIFAIDPSTGEIVAHARMDGSAHSMAADGEGRMFVLVNKSNKWFFQVINAR